MRKALTYPSGNAGNPYPGPELPLSTRTFHLAGAPVLARTIMKYVDHHRESKDKFIQMQLFWEKGPETVGPHVEPSISQLGALCPPSWHSVSLQHPCLTDTKPLILTLLSPKSKGLIMVKCSPFLGYLHFSSSYRPNDERISLQWEN